MIELVYHRGAYRQPELGATSDNVNVIGNTALTLVAASNPAVAKVIQISSGLVNQEMFFAGRTEAAILVMDGLVKIFGYSKEKMMEVWFKGEENTPYSNEKLAMQYYISALNSLCVGDAGCSGEFLENKINRSSLNGYWKKALERVNQAGEIFWQQFYPRLAEKHNTQALALQAAQAKQQGQAQYSADQMKLASMPGIGPLLAKYNSLDEEGRNIVTVTGALGGLVILTAIVQAIKEKKK